MDEVKVSREELDERLREKLVVKEPEPEVPGDDPDLRCPACGSWKTARFFRRYRYGGGKKTEETRMKCSKCGHGFFVNRALEE